MGALLAFAEGRQRMRDVFKLAIDAGEVVTIPTVVLAEWWRGQLSAKRRADILRPFKLEAPTRELCLLAGEACASVGATPIDAIVMASAAQRGDVVYTSDVDDLQRLRAFFPAVPRVLRALPP